MEELIYEAGAVAGAVARDASGRRRVIRARLTIGADGLRSVVARRLGGAAGRPRRLAFVAHVAAVPGLTGSAEMHVGADGYVGLNDIGHGIANVALVVPAARAREAGGRAQDFFFRQVDRFPGVHGRVQPAELARRVLVTGPFAATASRVTADGALLLGDAADFFDPFTGEGIYAALRGAVLAADIVPAALAAPGIVRAARLAGYRAARRRAFAGKWAVGAADWLRDVVSPAVRPRRRTARAAGAGGYADRRDRGFRSRPRGAQPMVPRADGAVRMVL